MGPALFCVLNPSWKFLFISISRPFTFSVIIAVLGCMYAFSLSTLFVILVFLTACLNIFYNSIFVSFQSPKKCKFGVNMNHVVSADSFSQVNFPLWSVKHQDC